MYLGRALIMIGDFHDIRAFQKKPATVEVRAMKPALVGCKSFFLFNMLMAEVQVC